MAQLEQNVLDLMHKHHDDIAGAPFLFLTPTRRPSSRSSSRASMHAARPHLVRSDAPASAPTSPLAMIFRRPHTPAASPLASGAQYVSCGQTRADFSPSSSPVLAHAQATQAHAQYTASLPSSPLSSPRLLNAKAHEFRPIPRPLSAASSVPGIMLRADTPSPDMWAHNSPRATSNLAIAAPLIADHNLLQRASTPSQLRSFVRPDDTDEEDDPFNPFPSKPASRSFHPVTVSDFDAQWSNSSNSSVSPEESYYVDNPPPFYNPYAYPHLDAYALSPPTEPEMDPDTAALLTDGMTPFDVLSSVFGSTLAPSELEEALVANGYDFEKAMAWLVDRALPSTATPSPTVRSQPIIGTRPVISRESAPVTKGRGLSTMAVGTSRGAIRPLNGRSVGNRVCRYFVAGECLRADCRYRLVPLPFVRTFPLQT